PTSGGNVKKPLLLFSHGLDGCSTQSTFLMHTLAAHGYWVFAPDHDDAGCGKGLLAFLRKPELAFDLPEQWSDATYAARRNDMVKLLEVLRLDPHFAPLIDFSRVGLIGHSLGGYTVLGLAGAWPSWTVQGVKAVLALSPYSEPFNVHKTLASIRIPIMLQGGSNDNFITPNILKAGGTYEQAGAPKYFVEFDGAGHFAWTDLNLKYAESIEAYSLAFLDHYVKGEPASRDLTSRRPDVIQLRYDSELGKKAGDP
ncbi:MAG: dienelactone hydrolase family protein, partial [Pseudomonadota bacterium]|nr:dienelactone hydrolase family protein [Pseudomonadota bacterium]